MPFQLVFEEPPGQVAAKAVGENVFFSDLPADCKVFLFYYPGAMPDANLEPKLRALGEHAGTNLFVNIGWLNDPQYGKIVNYFGITKNPVIIMTAIPELASPLGDYATLYARLDSSQLLGSADHTIQCVQELFNLFIQGKVAEAISQAKSAQAKEFLLSVTRSVVGALKSVVGFIADHDVTFSFLGAKLEVKKSGG
jgi:hypothetical protein